MEGSWQVDAEPRACPGLAGLAGSLTLAIALVPWVARCPAWLALLLSLVTLAGLPRSLSAVPGCGSRLQRLQFDGHRWFISTSGNGPREAVATHACRVFPGMAFCRFLVAGRRLDCWIPRGALAGGEFRRLKVALRCAAQGQGS